MTLQGDTGFGIVVKVVVQSDTAVDKNILQITIPFKLQWFIVAAGCVFLLLMFMMLQSSADDFFSPNLSTIVTHLKMSESVAVWAHINF